MKILYGVQGTGNGHITRARALNQELLKFGAQIDFVFSGRAPKQYFALDEFPQRNFLHGLKLAVHHGKVNMLQTWQQNNIKVIFDEINRIDTRAYDLVISDFEPITAWAAKLQLQHCLALGHQYAFAYNIPKACESILSRKLIKTIAPSSLSIGLHWYHFHQPILPPIIQHNSQLARSLNYYLVYLPFEDRQDIIDLLEPFENESFICFGPYPAVEKVNNVIFRPTCAHDFHPTLCGAKGVICNAGFELISEALQLGIKILAKPLLGQMEQISNARALVELGLGLSMNQLNPHQLDYWLLNFQPRQIKYPNVAQAIAQWIFSGGFAAKQPQKELAAMAKALWASTDFSSTPWLNPSLKIAA